MNPRKRSEFEARLHEIEGMGKRRKTVNLWYIVHWDVINRLDWHLIKFIHVIVDEIHLAKNRKSVRRKGLTKIKAWNKTGLSGTPANNRPEDFWSILNWIKRGEFGSYWRFMDEFVDYFIPDPEKGYHIIHGYKHLDVLRERIDPYFIRRTLDDVTDMPDKIYTDLPVAMTAVQRRAFDDLRKQFFTLLGKDFGGSFVVSPNELSKMTRLRQLSVSMIDSEGNPVLPSPKIEAVVDMLATNPDEPIVVFSQFRKALRCLQQELTTRGIETVRVDGEASAEDRERHVEMFQNGEVNVFLAVIQAGGMGFTLTRSHTVVFLDRSLDNGMNKQAEDRVWRLGQNNVVNVINVVSEGSLDPERLEYEKEALNILEELYERRSDRETKSSV